MFLPIVLTSVLCVPPPAPANPTPDTWSVYLTGVLHACYGHLGPAVTKTPVSLAGIARMAGSLLVLRDDGTAAAELLVEPDLLAWAPSEMHIAAILGHEAVHVALFEAHGYNPMPMAEEETAADLIAATNVRLGACLLIETYEWHVKRLEPADVPPVAKRIAALRPLCAAQRLLQ